MLEEFPLAVSRELLRDREVLALRDQYGREFDRFVGDTVLEHGQRHCDSRQLGLLYASRYAPMHAAAVAKFLPDVTEDVTMIEFGGGPGQPWSPLQLRDEFASVDSQSRARG
jgi:hypothetical protein